ncbi:nucleoside triphosphate pyrophosphohydrolase [Amphibacillus sediminis]|uniref:nucleoside triphosphate pyrophosphohydrolase n=1 Tax=Amphibacillus sediminis TaxID=360185 RepID=UPI0008371BAD|nr:nucleoside triphosphate pyrophosphohydrolase [Amphibacillus sediminis]
MNKIEILGLGAGELDQLSIGLYRKLTRTEQPIYVRTAKHPVLDVLKEEGLEFTAFDSIYQAYDSFESVYQEIVTRLISAADQYGTIIYAVPGHPMLAERTVQLLLNQDQIDIEVIGGQSYLDDLFTAIKIDPIEGFQFLDATSFERSQLDYQHHLVFCQVYDQMVASEVKLTLLEDLTPDHPVTIIEAAGSSGQRVVTLPLVELDQGVTLSNLTSVYIHPSQKEELQHQFFQLRDIIATLRGPNGCPWDQKQTHASLRPYLIEEAYELIDAINQEDDDQIIEELGDVLLQVMLHSQIGEDHGYFSIDDVIRSIVEKMIRRHPHVFGEAEVNHVDDVLSNWQTIKKNEKQGRAEKSLLDRVPQAASSLVKAEGLQKEAAKVGFDWDQAEDIWAKCEEEVKEVKAAIHAKDKAAIEEEFGDLLFAIVNLARYYKINSDIALTRTNQKFNRRFRFIEAKVKEQGDRMDQLSLEELDQIWEEAKRFE